MDYEFWDGSSTVDESFQTSWPNLLPPPLVQGVSPIESELVLVHKWCINGTPCGNRNEHKRGVSLSVPSIVIIGVKCLILCLWFSCLLDEFQCDNHPSSRSRPWVLSDWRLRCENYWRRDVTVLPKTKLQRRIRLDQLKDRETNKNYKIRSSFSFGREGYRRFIH